MRLSISWRQVCRSCKNLFLPGELLRLFLRRKKVNLQVAGSCHCCGRCCRSLSLEGPRGWLRSRRAFLRLQEQHKSYARFEITGRDSHGYLLFSCTMLREDGRCGDYLNRPNLCREYPHPDLPYSGGALFDGCGYYFTQNRCFAELLAQKQEKYKGIDKRETNIDS